MKKLILLIISLAFFQFFISSTWMHSYASEIEYKVVPTAELTKISYYMKKHEGSPKLFFEIGIKNISSEIRKYNVTVFLIEGPSGSMNFPRTKKLEPGKEIIQNFPLFYDKLPAGFTIVVDEY